MYKYLKYKHIENYYINNMGCYFSLDRKGFKSYFKIREKLKKYTKLENILEKEKLIGICYNDSTINLIDCNDNIRCEINMISYLTKGQYNYIYNIKIDKMNDVILSFYINDFFKNDLIIDHNDISNFINTNLIHNTLHSDKKYVPELYSTFYMIKKKKLLLGRIIEKLDLNASIYFLKERNQFEWFNFLFQVAFKLKYYQDKYNFNHSDFKINNIMAKYVSSSYVKYEYDNKIIEIFNHGIEWYFIDFGFSMIKCNNISYAGYEYFDKDTLNFKSEKDLSILCFSILYYVKRIHYNIKNFILECLEDLDIKNDSAYKLLNEKNKTISNSKFINLQFCNLYHKFNNVDFKNNNCVPINFIDNLIKNFSEYINIIK